MLTTFHARTRGRLSTDLLVDTRPAHSVGRASHIQSHTSHSRVAASVLPLVAWTYPSPFP